MENRIRNKTKILSTIAATLLVSTLAYSLSPVDLQVEAKEELSENVTLPCDQQAWPRISQKCLEEGDKDVRVISRVFVRGV